ncbi:MAG: 2-alkenal reductase [Gammaproteobacteria bacterium]|nr:MAG: 2-alkenal reductase [Gammaproteobacteria bacterium]RLA53592.1 MAG: 2-alkenal reductase [Gammaproteobacteria bacterium]
MQTLRVRNLKFFNEFGWPVLTGLLAATIVVMLLPHFTGEDRLVNGVDTAPVATNGGATTEVVSSYATAVRHAAPSVVNIYTRKKLTEKRHPLLNDPFFQRFFNNRNVPQQQRMESSLGSGVIMTADGFILTNHHVVNGADEIIILLYDGREAKATIVGTDPETDLAVLSIALDDLTPSTVTASKHPQVGDIVLAIGNPFGVGQSVSQGIISATGRKDLGLNTFENFIQTDASINPGNSGGALVDVYGDLVGINSAILNETSSVGIGFAIPAKTAIKVLEDIIKNGRVIRGWLGVEARQLAPQIASQLGIEPPTALLITDVHPASPAFESDLKPGDVVTHINGERISDGANSMNLIAQLSPGDPIQLDIVRHDSRLTIAAIAGTRPQVNQPN